MQTCSLRRFAAVGILLVFLAPGLSRADAFSVTTNTDAGAGSLRQAILDANATPVADTISFSLASGQTAIALASALPDVTGDLVLDGPSTALTIRGTANGSPLLRVASGETVIQDLTLEQGTVSMAAGARLSFDLATDRGFARDISDAGVLEKRGSAKLTLTGANTYTGGTSVVAGTLEGNAASLPGDISIASGSTLRFDQAGFATKAGVISGAGTLVKTGAGTLLLTGASTFTGQTSVSQGVLQGTAATLPGSTFSIAGGATLSFDQGTPATEASAISGAGALEKLGTATLTLTGTNTYTGGTRVVLGFVRGNTQSIPGDVSLGATAGVVFNQTVDGTHAGAISGGGMLIKTGAGTLTLSGTNTYTGGTAVNAGALRGTTSSLQGDIDDFGALIFDQASTGDYAGVISGTGTVRKAGAGTVRLTQGQSYTGATTIAGGALELAGVALTSDVGVLGGAALRGSGSVGGLDLASGASAVVHDASGFATLGASTASFAAGSRLEVRVAEGGGHDRLAAAGAVTLQPGAGLDLLPQAGSYAAPVSFDVLTAGSVTGTFDLIPQFAFLDVSLANLGDRIRATVQASGGTVSSFARTPNQRAVAQVLEILQPTATGDLATVFDSLTLLTAPEVPAALDELSGELVSDFEHARLSLSRRFHAAVDARLANLEADRPGVRRVPRRAAREGSELPAVGFSSAAGTGLGGWVDGLGLSGDIQGESGASDLDYRSAGGTFGIDLRPDRRTAIGTALGFASSDLELAGPSGDGSARSLLAGLYAARALQRLRLSASAYVGLHDMETERRIRIEGIDRLASGDFDGRDYGAALGARARLGSIGAFAIEPNASLSFARFERDAFSEDGAGALSLQIEDQELDSLQSGLGLRAAARYEVGEGLFFAPEFFATWLHEFGDVERELRARFTGATLDAPFRVLGAELPRDSALTGFRWVTSNAQGGSAELSYSALWNAQQLEHFASVGFHLVW